MPFSLIYFFAPVSIFYILHNYVIPQAMPHAIPQTHSAFYPHRYYTELYSTTGSSEEWFFCVCSYSEHEKQTREISEFFQLTLDQPAGGATKSRTDGNDRRILSEKLL